MVHRLKMRQRWYTDCDLLNLDLSILHKKINSDIGQVMSRCTRPHLHRGSGRALLIFLWLQLSTLYQSLFCIFQFIMIVCFIARNADAIRHGECFCCTFSICFPRTHIAGQKGIYTFIMKETKSILQGKAILSAWVCQQLCQHISKNRPINFLFY